eukprot:229160_1
MDEIKHRIYSVLSKWVKITRIMHSRTYIFEHNFTKVSLVIKRKLITALNEFDINNESTLDSSDVVASISMICDYQQIIEDVDSLFQMLTTHDDKAAINDIGNALLLNHANENIKRLKNKIIQSLNIDFLQYDIHNKNEMYCNFLLSDNCIKIIMLYLFGNQDYDYFIEKYFKLSMSKRKIKAVRYKNKIGSFDKTSDFTLKLYLNDNKCCYKIGNGSKNYGTWSIVDAFRLCVVVKNSKAFVGNTYIPLLGPKLIFKTFHDHELETFKTEFNQIHIDPKIVGVIGVI